MSTIRQILALMNDKPVSDTVLAVAAALARRHAATVSALHAVEPAVNGVYMTPEVAAVAIQYAEQSDHDRRQAANDRAAQAAFRRARARTGIPHPLRR